MMCGVSDGLTLPEVAGGVCGAALADAGGAVAFTAIGAVAEVEGGGVGSAVALTWIGSCDPFGSGAFVCFGALLQAAAKAPRPTRAAP